jgi:hypothetical protein
MDANGLANPPPFQMDQQFWEWNHDEQEKGFLGTFFSFSFSFFCLLLQQYSAGQMTTNTGNDSPVVD